MKKLLVIPALALLLLIITLVGWKVLHKEAIHYHAGFQVFVDDQMQDFTDLKYMVITPCGKNEMHEDEQLEKAHLHEQVGDVVHVHRTGAVWNDLFVNLKFPIDKSKKIQGLVNAKPVDDILNYPIKSYDVVQIFIGNHDPAKERQFKPVRIDHIKEVEKRSELCGKQ